MFLHFTRTAIGRAVPGTPQDTRGGLVSPRMVMKYEPVFVSPLTFLSTPSAFFSLSFSCDQQPVGRIFSHQLLGSCLNSASIRCVCMVVMHRESKGCAAGGVEYVLRVQTTTIHLKLHTYMHKGSAWGDCAPQHPVACVRYPVSSFWSELCTNRISNQIDPNPRVGWLTKVSESKQKSIRCIPSGFHK